MNHRSDIDRVLRQWMDDGPSRMPDRVLDVVADRISVQHQRRAWPLSGRTTVTTQIKLVAGLAAVLLVAVVGYSLLPRSSGPGGPTTSVEPTSAASASPSPSAVAYPSTILAPGSHASESFAPAFTFTLAEPWVFDEAQAAHYSFFPDSPANRAEWARTGKAASSLLLASELTRPWFFCETWEDNRGATAAEMLAAVTANEAITTTGAVDVEIGGLSGKQFDIRLSPDWTETCPDDAPDIDLGAQRTRVFFLDRPGSNPLVMWAASLRAADHDAFLAEVMPVIASLQFEVAP